MVPAHSFFSLYHQFLLLESPLTLFSVHVYPCWVEKWHRAGWVTIYKAMQGQGPFPLPFFFFFFKEKRYLDPSYLINYSNSPFYSVHINTTLICEPDSHPCLLNGGNLDLKNICCAPDLGRLGIIILESQPVEK